MVIEADTPGSRTVDMKLKIRAPIDKVREAIQPKSITHPDLGHGQLAEVWVDVSAMTQTIRDQVRKWKCARVDVEIVYPIKRKERKEPEGLSEGEGGEEGENGDKDEEGGDERNGRGGGRGDSETGLMGNVIQSTGSLIVQVHNSRVSVNLPNWVFRNKLSLSSTDKGGEIELLSAASTALTELKLEEGEISGRLATLHTVRAKVTDAEGRIQLDIDGNDKRIFSGSGLRPRMVANTTMTMTATARRNGTVMMAGGDPAIEAEPEEDPAQALDLAAMTAGGGPIQVQVFTPIAYQGRFNLMHEGERQFRRSSNDVPVVYTVKNRHQLTGYMAMGRKEPTLLLPNVDIQARGFRSGNVLLEFIHRSPPRSGGMRNGVPVQVYGLVVVAFIVQLLGAFL
ncbi:hypothetical protein BC939DRAFT_329991 [Gamsiella multidivaricata]|uniref:uncharacterized protein n=1 Tax=Gamsiella multidivaricata TaxID=101098 RepID=UPI002220D655|nr:uncharacterized protein BC939DRAFT_329991 [Gamsiella multidivaricata]KAI7817445.1 hypothetical protein BC939DRAFT_329991 [Gamsiella multidivaricata]